MIRVTVVRTSWMVRTCLRWEGPAVLLEEGDSRSPFEAKKKNNRGESGKVAGVCRVERGYVHQVTLEVRQFGCLLPCRLENVAVAVAAAARSWSAERWTAAGAEAQRHGRERD